MLMHQQIATYNKRLTNKLSLIVFYNETNKKSYIRTSEYNIIDYLQDNESSNAFINVHITVKKY